MNETNMEQMDQLKAVGFGDGSLLDIAQTALSLASLDRPGISLQKYEHHLKILCLDMKGLKLKSDTAETRAKALASLLCERHGYIGNEEYYDDLQNANLMSVIDTRKGLPVTLSLLYMHVARSQNWHVEGLKFPGHFLLRLQGRNLSRDGQVIIDPFHGGKILDAKDLRQLIQKKSNSMAELKPEYFEPISDRAILVRLLNNIKIRCLKVSDLGHAINILARLVMIDPQHMQNHYEMGMLLAHVGKRDLARETLLYCLDHIDKIEKNDLIEQQIVNTLADLDKQDKDNCHPLH